MKMLLTGANSGIGYAILSEFISNTEITAIDQTLLNLKNIRSNNLTPIQLNLQDLAGLSLWLEKLVDPFDVLINCAGVREIKPVLDLSLQEWQKVIDINLTAPFLISQNIARLAVSCKIPANIINIASISGLQAEPNRAAYCSSKHGIIGLTKQMAIEMGEHNIRINAIAPGIIQTELTEDYFKHSHTVNLIKKNTPLRKWGKPNNVVSAIKFILENDFISGSTIVIDGGWTSGKEL